MSQQAAHNVLQALAQEGEHSGMRLLKGKRALITGGTSGLGKEIALEFAKQGAHVAILGRNSERAQEVVEKLKTCLAFPKEQRVSAKIVDVTSKSSVDKEVGELLKEWEGIDILVNCAGMTRDKLFMAMKEEDWDSVIETNLKSVYNVCQAVTRRMIKARRGKIINITSVVGLMGNPGQTNYAASKLGMVGFTRSLAKELAARGICVNCIAPGFFETPMTDRLNEKQREAILKQVPMGRLGNPVEIAYAALFLASDLSDYVTGQVLTVDGGMLA